MEKFILLRGGNPEFKTVHPNLEIIFETKIPVGKKAKFPPLQNKRWKHLKKKKNAKNAAINVDRF